MAGLTKCDYLRAVSEYDRHIMLDLNTALGSHLTPQYGSSASLVHEAVILFKKHLLVSNQTQVYLLYRMGGDRDKWDWVAYTFSADSFQLKECVGKGRASSSLWSEDHNLRSCRTRWPPCPESLRSLFLTCTCPPWILVLRCITKESEKMGSFFHPLIWKSQTALTQSLCGRDWRGRWWIFDFESFFTPHQWWCWRRLWTRPTCLPWCVAWPAERWPMGRWALR